MRTVSDVIKSIRTANSVELPAPSRIDREGKNVVLGVSSMKDHMTDEGWQITHGISQNGYLHCGYGLDEPETDVSEIIRKHSPGTIVIQDVREWDVKKGDFRDHNARFTNIESMKTSDAFRVTILKDAHQNPEYQRYFADAMGIHAWVVYYNQRIVKHLAPYVRPQHLIRTTHSIDPSIIPEFSMNRPNGCLFSGAVSGAYPLRQYIMSKRRFFPMTVHKHPGYHRSGSAVPAFMSMLNTFKASICTSSKYGYLLRKIIESTACGCRVITDLPSDEKFPVIEENLIRVGSSAKAPEIKRAILMATGEYDYEKQKSLASAAIEHYGYLSVCKRLVDDIELLKRNY